MEVGWADDPTPSIDWMHFYNKVKIVRKMH